MKRAHLLIRRSLLSLVVALAVMTLPMSAMAMEHNGQAGEMDPVTGSFDGLNLKERRIWIGDMVYLLDGAVTVQGTSVKLGLLSDLKQGETIKAYLRENEANVYVPYVIKIERQ